MDRKGEAAINIDDEDEQEGAGRRGSVEDETISLTDRPIAGKDGEGNLCIPLRCPKKGQSCRDRSMSLSRKRRCGDVDFGISTRSLVGGFRVGAYEDEG